LLQFILEIVESKSEFDFMQALLNSALRVSYSPLTSQIHFDSIIEDDKLIELVRRIKQATETAFSGVEAPLLQGLCLTSHTASVLMV